MRTATLNIIAFTLITLMVLSLSSLISLSSRNDTMELSMQNAIEDTIKLLENNSLNYTSDMTGTGDNTTYVNSKTTFYSDYNKCIKDAIKKVAIDTNRIHGASTISDISDGDLASFLGIGESSLANFKSIQDLMDSNSTHYVSGTLNAYKILERAGFSTSEIDGIQKIQNKALEYIFCTLLVQNSVKSCNYTVEFYGVSATDGYLHLRVTEESPVGLPSYDKDGKMHTLTQKTSMEKAIIIVNKSNL